MRGAWLGAILAFAGCDVSGEFHCDTNAQCTGHGGQKGACVTGSCAFGDTGCASGWRFDESAAESLAGACLDGTPPANCAAWTPRHFAACSLPAPIGAIHLDAEGYIYDTDLGEFLGGPTVPHASIVSAQTDGTGVRIISTMGFTLDAQVHLRVIGSLPLIIASWGDSTVAGKIDASSAAGSVRGPGAGFAGCKAATSGLAGVASGGSGGGGGGGFAGPGGAGGQADSDNGARAGGTGGLVLAMPAAIVHGGCPGAPGGALGPSAMAPLTPTSAAFGGAGGGAIQLTAHGKLVMSGAVNAGGAGGGGGPGYEAGAGGGGSGGYLGLEAPMLTVSGILAANGGGGGAGAIGGAMTGASGSDGNQSTSAAGGGSAGTCASGGASGAAGASLAGGGDEQSAATCGGGGGGGGAGVITIRATAPTMTGSTVSPPATIDPS